MLKHILYLILSTVLITACETQVKIDIPYDGDKLVVNSFLRQDSLVYVRLTQSDRYRASFNFLEPSAAIVQLYENGTLKEVLTKRTINSLNYYVSTTRANPLKAYSIIATAPGLPVASGGDVIPPKPLCRGNNFSELVDGFKLQFVINDPAATKNYYMLRIRPADTNRAATGPRIRVQRNSVVFFRADAFGSNEYQATADRETYSELYFSDERFNGRQTTVTIKLDSYNNTSLYIAPELVSLTEGAYKYLVSYDRQQNNQGNFLAEASQVYNNITNGYGIIAGTSDSLLLIRKN
jgi:hypothetical protein